MIKASPYIGQLFSGLGFCFFMQLVQVKLDTLLTFIDKLFLSIELHASIGSPIQKIWLLECDLLCDEFAELAWL
jgi:hypothetical protein